MNAIAVFALLAAAFAAVAAAPQQGQNNNNLQQATNIQVRSSQALDLEVLNEVVLKAYNNLWNLVSNFFYLTKVSVQDGAAEFIIIEHHHNFLAGSQTRYQQFRAFVYSGDEDLSRSYADIAARAGDLLAEEAIFEACRTVKEYNPKILEEIKENGRQTYASVKVGFEPVFELLKPEQPSELNQVINIKARSSRSLDLDPVILDEAVLKAYNNLWNVVSYFFYLAKGLVHDGNVQYEITMHQYNFMDGTQARYKQFREVLSGGDEDEIRTYGEIAARYGNLWAEEAVFETSRTVKQYEPEVLDQVQKIGQQTYANVTAGFEPVFELLKPEQR